MARGRNGCCGLNFTPINPLSALYWSAVVNGVAAAPFMVLLMIMAARRRVMGEFTIGYGLKTLGLGGDACDGGLRHWDGRHPVV
jgi:Mn2+/Fe2+ NRAMP family transporter